MIEVLGALIGCAAGAIVFAILNIFLGPIIKENTNGPMSVSDEFWMMIDKKRE